MALPSAAIDAVAPHRLGAAKAAATTNHSTGTLIDRVERNATNPTRGTNEVRSARLRIIEMIPCVAA
jgi:hypothetical protein